LAALALAPAYRPRRPTETVLYAVVSDHLETFLAHARKSYEAPLPRYVEDELRGYLKCGVFAHGFIRAHCETCGHDLLVAFSCKARSVCPSCAGRRMANTAANLVDRVLPAVPVRQWVLSLPWELRALAAFNADVLSALARIFVEAIFARHKRWAKQRGLGKAPSGAVTHVQRFGSSINLNVHFHVMVIDGVFTRDEEGRTLFHSAPSPTHEELDLIVRLVRRRAIAWLTRKGHLGVPSEEHTQDAPAQTSLDACAAIAMARGTVQRMGDEPKAERDGASDLGAPPANERAVEHDGFNLHADVAIAGDDDLGRERLMRYGARPPLALDRLRRLPGGRIAYRIKKLRNGRAKHRVMTPLEFLARLAAIVPPPRYPLLRYHGVLGPRSAWRRDIVPKAREPRGTTAPRPCPQETPARNKTSGSAGKGTSLAGVSASLAHPRVDGSRTGVGPDGNSPPTARPEGSDQRSASTADPGRIAHMTSLSARGTTDDRPTAPATILLAPNVLSTKHWDRLLGGALYAVSTRVDWAALLRRSFDVDVLRCPQCAGRLRVLGEVTEPTMVGLILEILGLPRDAPRARRARDPTDLLGAEAE
jgi:hypothetical protein